MDSARAALQSDPTENRQFRRRWAEPPAPPPPPPPAWRWARALAGRGAVVAGNGTLIDGNGVVIGLATGAGR